MKDPRRPLEPHETSYLLLHKLQPDLTPRHSVPSRPSSRMGLHCTCEPQSLPADRMALHTCEVSELIGYRR